MAYRKHLAGCATCSWVAAAAISAAASGLLWVLGGWAFMPGVFIGALVFGCIGALLSFLFCRPLPALGEVVLPGDNAMQAADAPAPNKMPGEGVQVSSEPIEAKPAPTVSYGAKEMPAPDTARPAQTTMTQAPKRPETAPTAVKPAQSKPAQAKPAATTSSEGAKPELLNAPRGGQADDLKQIKGVGPGLEKELNAKGVYHFDQIASWTPDEVAWADQNLVRFKGRVSRDDWVAQAKQFVSDAAG